MEGAIKFLLNGKPATAHADEGGMLLWALRGQLGLTGTKYGCGDGLCGACTVSVDGRAVHACVTPVGSVASKKVVTVEGLASGKKLHPLQQSFIDHGALQCGYCTPGMLMAAEALLRDVPSPSRDAIATRLEHNLCRCGTHQRVISAIESAAQKMALRS